MASDASDILARCRTCLNSTEGSGQSIFQDGFDMILSDCLSINVEEDDQLPQSLCNPCWHVVDSFSKFKKHTHQNDKLLRQYLLSDFNDDALRDQLLRQWDATKAEINTFHQIFLCSTIKEEDYMDNSHLTNGASNNQDLVNHVAKKLRVNKSRKSKDKTHVNKRKSTLRKRRININNDLGTEDAFINNVKSEIKLEISSIIGNDVIDDEVNWVKAEFEDNDSDMMRGDGEVDEDDKSNDGPEVCYICDRRFHLKSMLTRHMTLAHKETPKYPCTVCDLVLSTTRTLREHMMRHSEPMRKCPDQDCKEQFDTLRNLVRHVRKVHKYKRREKCDTCAEKFFVIEQLDKHVKKFHVKKELRERRTCLLCGLNFKNMGKHMLSHRVTTVVPDKFECSQCGKPYKTRKSLWVHVKSIHESRMCHICGERYYGNAHLLKHSGAYKRKISPKKEPTPDDVSVCDLCNKVFDTKRKLDAHKSLSHFPKMVTCQMCAKVVRKKNYLKHVRVVHEQMVKATCAICGAQFKEQFRLKEHMRIHTDERPFACAFCERRFRNKNTMKKHVRLHTGEKPYVCKICGRSFAQCTPLKSHLKTHLSCS